MRTILFLIAFSILAGCQAGKCPIDTAGYEPPTNTTIPKPDRQCTFTDGVEAGWLGNEITFSALDQIQSDDPYNVNLLNFEVKSLHEDCEPIVVSGFSFEIKVTEATSNLWVDLTQEELYVRDEADNQVMLGIISGWWADEGVQKVYYYFSGTMWIDPGATQQFRVWRNSKVNLSGNTATLQTSITGNMHGQSGPEWFTLNNPNVVGSPIAYQY